MEKNNEEMPINSSPQEDNEGDEQDVDPVDNMDEEAAAKEKLTSDPSKVKFTSVNLDGYGKNGEAKVDIHVVQTTVGMGKEELMKYANEPYWVRLRLFLFVLFWLGWIAMLVGAIVIILLAPRCPPPPKLDWYEKTAVYQIEVKAFKDSDEDGIGDLRGLISKLDYFTDINVGTLLLSAFYAVAPGSGGIVNHTAIDSRYGTMSDFEDLVAEMKKRDMKLMIDFNPNHSSDKHVWFQKSIIKEEPFKDYYIWAESPSGLNNLEDKPSNWLSVSGGSAWEWNDVRNQYYYHAFGKEEPDLNLRNVHVKQELEDIMRFWLEKGVDGFKIVGASYMFENEMFRDEPLLTNKTVKNPQYGDLNHIYTIGQNESFGLLQEWRTVLANFSSEMKKVFMAELSESVNNSIQYYRGTESELVEFPINVELMKLDEKSSGSDLKQYINSWISLMPENAWPNWLLGSKQTKRLANRVGSDLIDGIHMVGILARGTPITYYGDELALQNSEISELFAMPWNNETFGGFTNSSNYVLQLYQHYQSVNVQAQQKDKQSHLNIFSRLLNLRNQPAIQFGLQEYPVVSENIFSMIRVRKGSPAYLVILNMAENSTVIDFSETSTYLPEAARVEVRSCNIDEGPLAGADHPKVWLNNILLEGSQSVVLSFVPQFDD